MSHLTAEFRRNNSHLPFDPSGSNSLRFVYKIQQAGTPDEAKLVEKFREIDPFFGRSLTS
jgi:hypothetical protein